MTFYLTLKLLHILSAVVVAGTGAGIAFFMLMAYLSRNTQAIYITARHVVLGDWLFTTPAIIMVFVTGVLMMTNTGLSFTSPWFLVTLALFIFIGLCWLPVLYIQYRLRALALHYLDDARATPGKPVDGSPSGNPSQFKQKGDALQAIGESFLTISDEPNQQDYKSARDQSVHSSNELPQEFHRLMRLWILLGILAFTAILVVFYMMVFKPLPLV